MRERKTVRQLRRSDDPDELVFLGYLVPRKVKTIARDLADSLGEPISAVLRAWSMDKAKEAQERAARGD